MVFHYSSVRVQIDMKLSIEYFLFLLHFAEAKFHAKLVQGASFQCLEVQSSAHDGHPLRQFQALF